MTYIVLPLLFISFAGAGTYLSYSCDGTTTPGPHGSRVSRGGHEEEEEEEQEGVGIRGVPVRGGGTGSKGAKTTAMGVASVTLFLLNRVLSSNLLYYSHVHT